MAAHAVIERIVLYPIKSLDGIAVSDAQILTSGAFENDRRFALFDTQDRVVNGKRMARIHKLRATYELPHLQVTLWEQDRPQRRETFSLLGDSIGLARWLSEYFGFDVVLRENPRGGFPDDTDSPGPTIVSRQSLEMAAAWFPGLTADEARHRFRANIELDAPEPFWEDHLAGEIGQTVPFRAGYVRLAGVNPCQRCVVPSRSPVTGDITPGFAAKFADERESSLPLWSPQSQFDHYYRLAINTRPLDGQPGRIAVGDRIEIL